MIKSLRPFGTDRNVARRESNPFSFLQQEIDRLFEGVTRGFPSFPSFAGAGPNLPRMDVSETDEAIEIEAELPGLESKDVQISLSDEVLTIRGEKKNEHEEKDKNYHLIERSYGSFSRSMELPLGVKPEDVSAEIAKGVLKVTVKKPAPKQSKQIEIKPAA